MENAAEQPKNRNWDHLKEHQFKPGQSGNPAGRPKGSSLKEWARIYFDRMTDDEKLEYLAGMDKIKVWEMAEGSPKKDVEIDATLNGPGSIKLDE